MSDGSAVIKATANGLTAEAAVQVKGRHDPFVWSFTNHVVPVLTKKGCNSGPCHGASAGKNGFKLSFRGYAPEADYEALTRESTARRISLADPSSSLFLLKPTMTIPHGGGRRFPVDSREFQILSEWIAGGAPSPTEQDASVISLEVYPLTATLAPGGRTAACRPGKVFQRRSHRRYAMGQIQFDRCRRRRGQRGGFGQNGRPWRGGGHCPVLEPGHLFAADGSSRQ